MAEVNESMVQRFISETNCSTETARFYLEMCNGDFNQALEQFIQSNMQNGERLPGHQQHHTVQQNNPGGEAIVPRNRRRRLQGVIRFVAKLVLLPMHLVKATFYVCRVVMKHSLALVAQILLPSTIRNRYIATNENLEPALQAAEFRRAFHQQYGTQHPNFVELGWKEAAREAENQSKFLFAYLHAPQHEDTDEFCRNVLASPDVISFLDQHFLCWGGSIDRTPAFVLATTLGATTFPCMCLLSYSGSQATVITSIQGTITAPNLRSVLQQALDEQGAMMNERRAERHRRERDRQIREDQDLEYQRALEADRERDRRNREVAAAAEAEQEAARLKMEEETLAKERAMQEKLNHEERIEQRKLTVRMHLGEEPAAGDKVAQIRVRLPDGSTYNRRFLESSKFEEVYDFVDSLENLRCWDYTLVRSFPQFAFNEDTRQQSLAELDVL